MAYHYLPREDCKVWFCLPLNIFYYFISNQEQHNHIIHEILVKLHVRSIFIGAADKKLWQLQFTVATIVISSKAASYQVEKATKHMLLIYTKF